MKTYQKLWELGVACRKLHPKFDVTSWTVLLYVALHEGTSSANIQIVTGIPQSTVSRAVAFLSGVGTESRSALHLIALEPNPEDRRGHKLFLTEEGKAIMKTLRAIVEA